MNNPGGQCRSIAFYPGSFDPVTNGHIDLIQRALFLFDRVIVAIGSRYCGKPLFSREERIDMLESVVRMTFGSDVNAISVISFPGLTVDAARDSGASVILRGVRDSGDFDYEMRMASMNKMMNDNIQTVFFPASPENRCVTSSLVRQISASGGDVHRFVPSLVASRLADRYALVQGIPQFCDQ